MFSSLSYWLFFATTVAVLSALGASMRLNERLRSKHYAVWTLLGQPEFPAHSFDRQIGAMRLMRFVVHGDYKTLGDITVNRLARAIICFYLLSIVLALAVVAFALAR
jgi:hypothetical protein